MRFFHGSGYEYKVGQTVTAKKNKGFYDEAEKIMEMYRPRDQVSRLQAIYMVQFYTHISMAGGDDSNIYQVEPLGKVTKVDHGWMGKLWREWYNTKYIKMEPVNPRDEKYQTLAEGYWGGKFYPEKENHQWEYLSKKVKVIDIKYQRYV